MKPTIEQAQQALDILIEYGRQGYKEDYQHKVSAGQCLGRAVSCIHFTGHLIAIDAAGEALEDRNWHSEAAIVRKLANQND